MIYTRWGLPVEIKAAALDIQVEHLPAPVTLVRCADGRHRFAEFLIADGGFNEVNEAVKAAESLSLSTTELAEAIQEAS